MKKLYNNVIVCYFVSISDNEPSTHTNIKSTIGVHYPEHNMFRKWFGANAAYGLAVVGAFPM